MTRKCTLNHYLNRKLLYITILNVQFKWNRRKYKVVKKFQHNSNNCFFDGRELDDKKTLEDFYINGGSTLHRKKTSYNALSSL